MSQIIIAILLILTINLSFSAKLDDGFKRKF